MRFYTETVCETLPELDRVKAIRAIHRALFQFEAGEKLGFDCLDNSDAIAELRACLRDAGHVGYFRQEPGYAGAGVEAPPHRCGFCGAPSWVDPSDQTPPPDYCHPEDHGSEADAK